MLAKIDPNRLNDLRQQHGSLSSDSPGLWRHYSKYLDASTHLQRNIERAQDLNLHRLPPQQILDIGCGGGYFLFVAQELGHQGLGLDVGGIPVFEDLVTLLQISRVEYKINAFEALPDFGRKFDLITAFATAFHGGQEDSWRWSDEEWDFFLSDLKRNLAPGGRITLDLNAAYHGKYYTPEILQTLLRHGGVIERNNVLFA
ncbi:MAG: class I SAM-dependent methyltransferase [Spartobacteria bacterium]